MAVPDLQSAPTIAAPVVPAIPEPSTTVAPTSAPRTVIPLPSIAAIAAPAAAPVKEAIVPAPMVPAVVHPPDTRRARAFATEPHPGIATLLDSIRMLSGTRASRIVVFCGASTAEAVGTLAASLAVHAEDRGMKAFVGTLLRTTTGAIVAPAQGALDENVSLRVDLDGGAASDALHDWVQRVAPASDLVVLTGPPLASSIDAALLACACDGLVIVAESEVTDRAALHTAAERARIAGCHTLGVVMHGTKDRMPGWVRRFMGDRSQTPVRED
jgi:hypothetical protein